MQVLVYGAGGIGLYFAARLAQAGHEVTLKGRSATVDAFTRGTLRVLRAGRTTGVDGIEVVDRLVEGASFDLVVLATKAWQVSDAAREIAPVIRSDSRVLTTQNGVDAPERVRAHVPGTAVLGGTVVVIAHRREADLVEVVGADATVNVGSPERSVPDETDRVVIDALTGAGISTRWAPNVGAALWKKLALIASYGGVGALAGATVGQTRSTPQTRDLVEGAMREVLVVANAEGARLGETDLAEILHTYEVGFAPETTASMQRDLAEGRPSELEDQNGAVVRHAAAVGVEVPIHRTIYASQLPRELVARGITPDDSHEVAR